METVFDILAIALFIAAASLFFMRFRHENPPLWPYLLVSLVAATGNWLGNSAEGLYSALGAVAFLMGGAFFTLHLASEPYREDDADGELHHH